MPLSAGSNHHEQWGKVGYRDEEEGRQQQGGAGQVHSHPATAPACPQPRHGDRAKVAPVPDWQGTEALPGRTCRMAFRPIEGKQITATEFT